MTTKMRNTRNRSQEDRTITLLKNDDLQKRNQQMGSNERMIGAENTNQDNGICWKGKQTQSLNKRIKTKAKGWRLTND